MVDFEYYWEVALILIVSCLHRVKTLGNTNLVKSMHVEGENDD